MNLIFLSFQNIYCLTYLYFEENNNHLLINGTLYYFEIINKHCLKILSSTSQLSFFLTTYDNILYFEHIHDQRFIYLVNFIYQPKVKNMILNFKNNKIYSITDFKNGNFEQQNNQILIHWNDNSCKNNINNTNINNKNRELLLYFDDHSYISNTLDKNKYPFLQALSKNNSDLLSLGKNIKIVIFIHVCWANNGPDILKDQLLTLRQSKMYSFIQTIYIGIVGLKHKDSSFLENINDERKIKILYQIEEMYYYELKTIQEIKLYCDQQFHKNEEAYILYIHTKGVRQAGNHEVIESWRKMMEYFLIEQGIYCLNNLEYVDALGNNIINNCGDQKEICSVHPEHCYHFSGNFWWSKSSYIHKLPLLHINEKSLQQYYSENNLNYRFQAENWILSCKELPKVGILYQDDSNLHPYHRYIHSIYKNYPLFLKKYELIF
jgi:hypothetical protein